MRSGAGNRRLTTENWQLIPGNIFLFLATFFCFPLAESLKNIIIGDEVV